MLERLYFILTALSLSGCMLQSGPAIEQPTPLPTFTPAASAAQAPAAQQMPVLAGKPTGGLLVWLYSSPHPPSRGDTTLEVLIAEPGGLLVDDATVSFDIDMTNMSHGKNVTTAASLGDGRYHGDVFFLMPGPWRVIVDIERPAGTASVRFDFMVNW